MSEWVSEWDCAHQARTTLIIQTYTPKPTLVPVYTYTTSTNIYKTWINSFYRHIQLHTNLSSFLLESIQKNRVNVQNRRLALPPSLLGTLVNRWQTPSPATILTRYPCESLTDESIQFCYRREEEPVVKLMLETTSSPS